MEDRTNAAEACESLLDTGDYHDFYVKCRDRVWKCHRAILCPRSKYFKTICDRRFNEGVAMGQIVTVTFRDDDPETVDLLLRHLYRLEEPCFDTTAARYFRDVLIITKIGHKYDANILLEAGIDNLYGWVHSHVVPENIHFATSGTEKLFQELEVIWHLHIPGLARVRRKIIDNLVIVANQTTDYPRELAKFMIDRQDFAVEFDAALKLSRQR